VIPVITLERAMAEYFRFSRPEFCENNPSIPPIFSASAAALATRMWIQRYVPIPATFYIALIGDPRSGKTAFYHAYLRLFQGTGIGQIPVGSPPAMVRSLKEIQHGYIYYDEVSHLAKLIKAYMGDLLPILNRAYYLDAIEQTRTDSKKSVVVDPEEYFVHVYFAGTPKDWKGVEDQAMGGFVRRTLVLYTRGQIPFFVERELSIEEERRRAQLSNLIRATLRALTGIQTFVSLKGLSPLASRLEREMLDVEKKSMVEEYIYKILAGRLLANLVTIDLDDDPDNITADIIRMRIKSNARRQGVGYDEYIIGEGSYEVRLSYDVTNDSDDNDAKIVDYLPPNFARTTYEQLIRSVRSIAGAPDEITLRNVQRIQQWLNSGGSVVVSKRKFAQQILHTTNPSFYKPVLEILQDAGYIKIVDSMYKGRKVQYVILDTKAKICGNCALFRTDACPRVQKIMQNYDFSNSSDLYQFILEKTRPYDKACDEFEPANAEVEKNEK